MKTILSSFLIYSILISSVYASDKPYCQDVYQKKLERIAKNKQKSEKTFKIFGSAAAIAGGTAFTVSSIATAGVGFTLAFGWIGILPAAAFPALGVFGVSELIFHDWGKKLKSSHLVLNQGLTLSYEQIVAKGHLKKTQVYEANIKQKHENINKRRVRNGYEPIGLSEVKNMFPQRRLTEEDRAVTAVDMVANKLGRGPLDNEADYENFRLQIKDVLFSERVCPKGKAISFRKLIKTIRREI